MTWEELLENEDARSVYNKKMPEIISRQSAANQAYSRWGVRSGNLGSLLQPGLNAFFPGKPGLGPTGLGFGKKDIWTGVESLGNILSGAMRAGEWDGGLGEGEAGVAGFLADVQNEDARGRFMDQAGRDLRDMNFEADGMRGRLTDSAVNQANSYGAGMAAIGMSGIEEGGEGSGNMKRNLDYGQSRADAEEQLAFALMGAGASDYSNAMAQSFSDLSARKGRETAAAWGAGVRGVSGAMDAEQEARDQYIQEVQPDLYAADDLIAEMGRAAKMGDADIADLLKELRKRRKFVEGGMI